MSAAPTIEKRESLHIALDTRASGNLVIYS